MDGFSRDRNNLGAVGNGKCHLKNHHFDISKLDRAVLLTFHHNIVLEIVVQSE